MSPSSGCALLLLLAGVASAQPAPYLVKNIADPSTNDITFSGPVVAGSRVFFTEMPDGLVPSLWVSDGTGTGTHLVKDLRGEGAGDLGTGPNHLTPSGDLLYFTAGDKPFSAQPALWRTDGTAAGTRVLERPGPFAKILAMAATPTGLFYSSTQTLWRTDGTPGGAVVVDTFADPLRTPLVTLGERALFLIAGGLWANDGTPGSTVSLGPALEPLSVANGLVWFVAAATDTTADVWKSDGTVPGTVRVAVVSKPAGLPPPNVFVGAGSTVYFCASSFAVPSPLWASDGTEAGTRVLPDVGGAMGLHALGSRVLVRARNGASTNSYRLWVSDGTPAGTGLLGSAGLVLPEAFSMAVLGNQGVFPATDPPSGTELWRTDGTSAGTSPVTDLAPGTASSNPVNLVALNGRALFSATPAGLARRLFSSDGTSPGTKIVPTANASERNATIGRFQDLGPRTVFLVNDFPERSYPGLWHLWATDGTPFGTTRLADFPAPVNPPSEIVAWNGRGFFQYEGELYATDGSTSGTLALASCRGGPFATPLGVFFLGDADGGLWKTDGTKAGTVSIAPATQPGGFAFANGLVFFSGEGPPSDPPTYAIWKSDGTAAGTVPVHVFPPSVWSRPLMLGAAGAAALGLFWNTDVNIDPTATLFRTDGTVGTLTPVATLAVSFYTRAVASGSLLFFGALGTSEPWRVWRSDGTAAGTFSVFDAKPLALTAALGRVFFAADGPAGIELFSSDGTPAGTKIVTDLLPGDESSAPTALRALAGGFFFVATDGAHGREIWTSDGTETGTARLTDVFPGASSSIPFLYYSWDSVPGDLGFSNGRLLFGANDGTYGTQLWALRPAPTTNASSLQTVTPCRLIDTRTGAGAFGGPPLAAGSIRAFPGTGACGIPATARQLSVNVTVTNAASGGFLEVYADGLALPLASTISFRAGQTRANNAIVALGSNGEFAVASGFPTGTVDFIVDVNGWFE